MAFGGRRHVGVSLAVYAFPPLESRATGKRMNRYSKQIVFALHICFAILTGALFILDAISAEAYLVKHVEHYDPFLATEGW